MKIQFKKLVFQQTVYAHECYTTPFRFIIYTTENGVYLLEIHSHIGLEKRMFCIELEGAKKSAQRWFESQLTQFIETSENAAQ